MYRQLLLLLLCQAVAPAPQAMTDSDITYVKLEPPVEAPAAPSHFRESRIENLPLTIPGNVTFEGNLYDKTESIRNISALDHEQDVLADSDLNLPESSNLSEITALPEAALPESSNLSEITALPETALPESSNFSEITALPEAALPESSNFSEKFALPEAALPESSNLSEITSLPEAANTTDDKAPAEIEPEIDLPVNSSEPELTAPETAAFPEKVPGGTVLTEKTGSTEELLEAHGSDISDAIPSETYQSERRGRTYDSIETTDIFEEATEKYATELPEIEIPRTKPPKFVPKLSYFQKPQVFVSFPTNSIEKTARRKFRSHCRCEKIWNCPKLQITVPRCPDEYFLCCF